MQASICTVAPGLTNVRANMDVIVSQRFLFDGIACVYEHLFFIRHCAVGEVGPMPKAQALLL